MSRAKRVENSAAVERWVWTAAGTEEPLAPAGRSAPADASRLEERLAARARAAVAEGHPHGARSGFEAGAPRVDVMLRRLAGTIREIEELRPRIVEQTERQIVQLALAVARRILRREVTLDEDLTVAMCRVALNRLGDSGPVTIRLHPEDHARLVALHGGEWTGLHVTLTADPTLSRGGCLVDSPFGFVDTSVDAQFQEIARVLTVDEEAAFPVSEPAAVMVRAR